MKPLRSVLKILLLITAFIGIYATAISFARPYTGITLSVAGEISYLDPQGPASLAGVLDTDIITEINGNPLNASQPFYQDVEIGNIVTYRVQRNADLLDYTIITVLTPPHASANRLVIMLLGWIFWFFGFFLTTRNHPKFSPAHFVIFAISVSAALFALEDAERGYSWARYTMYCTLPISGAAWLNVHRNFPVTVRKRWQLICDTSYIIATVLTLTTLILGPNQLTYIAAGLGYSPQLPSNIIRWVWSAECLAGLYLLVQGYRIQTGDARRRVRFVTIGGLIGLVPVATILIAEAVNFYGIPNTIALTGLIALPVTYSISLTKTDIIRLETKFYRTLIAGSLILLVPLMYWGLISIVNWSAPSIGASPITGGIIALLLTATYSWVHSEVELLFRRIFFNEKPDHFKQLAVLTKALKTLSSQLDKETVVSLLTTQIPAEINVKKAGLWFVENNAFVWKGGEITDLPTIALGRELRDISKITLTKPRLLQNDELAVAEDVRWWIPLVTSEKGKGDELHGLWLLGPRENDESFSPGDIELIDAASQECALAVKAIRLLADLRHQLQQTENVWRRTIQIREQEQQRIAMDLHDDVIQLVFSCGLNIQAIIRSLEAGQMGQPTLTTLKRTGNLLDEIGTKTRLICYNLRPDALTNRDFLSMLLYLIEETESRTSVKVSLQVSPATLEQQEQLHRLDNDVKIGMYRIAQEALNNVTKHAGATCVKIFLWINDVNLKMDIWDNGRGFNLKETLTSQQGGLGLATIRTRASDINARAEIQSQIGEGTTISITVPQIVVANELPELSVA